MSTESISFYALIVLWINFISSALPSRVCSTYVELLIGAIISRSGHVTDALLAVGHQKHFSTYYWLLAKAKWSWFKVAKQIIALIVKSFPRMQWNLVVDDFVCPRSSKYAPGAQYHHEHSQKPNRPKYIWGQQWVALGLSLTWGKMSVCLPLIPRLHEKVGNTTKLTTARALVRSVLSSFRKTGQEMIRCLVDCWYMKAKFILPLVKSGVHCIGQVRKDTALFNAPQKTKKKKRGRKKKYGTKLTKARVGRIKIKKTELNVYGKCQKVSYRATQCLARFLKGLPVIAVWVKLPSQKKWMLILCTDLTLTPERIIKLYARRWKIEPMFNEIKHQWGVVRAWEQTTDSLHRWVSILCVSYTLTRMFSVLAASTKNRHCAPLIQWRVNKPVTAGLIRLGLKFYFRHFSFSQLWQPKSNKLIVPRHKK